MEVNTKTENRKDIYRASRLLYIIEAALEYFISMMAGGAYLATITDSVGMKDSTTGILSAFVSLGVGFQIIALLIPGRISTKKWVTPLHLFDQLLFTMLYVIPLFDISSNTKSILIVVLLLGGRIISNIVFSPKIAWLMGLVDEHKRGKFTAVKEIVSLISGMIFTLVMGRVVDTYKAAGNVNGAFIVCGITVFGLTVLHAFTLIFAKEKPKSEQEMKEGTVKAQIVGIFTNKNFWKVLPLLIFWSIANYASTPFFGTYQISELAFSMTLISVINILASVTRASFSLPIGGFADRKGFSRMLMLCFLLMFLAFVTAIFTTPETKYLFIVYSVLHAIGMAGMNNGDLNLVLDYTSRRLRVGAIAIRGLICGIAGFLTTLAVSPLVDYIQKSGNMLFGIKIYAQQITSAISAFMCIVAIVYMLTVVRKIRRTE